MPQSNSKNYDDAKAIRKKSVRFFLNDRELKIAMARARDRGMGLPKYARARVVGVNLASEELAAVKRALRPVTDAEVETIRLATLAVYQLDAIARYLDETLERDLPGNWWALEVAMTEIAKQLRPLRNLCVHGVAHVAMGGTDEDRT